MNKDSLFQRLREKDAETLLRLLQSAYDFLSPGDREMIFDQYVQEAAPAPVNGELLLSAIEQFAVDSRRRLYYEPFPINSKNFMYVPKKTKAWFKKLGDLLQDSCQLTVQGEHLHAVTCFSLLYELIDKMESGEDIVFGDEIGSWMIPGDEGSFLTAYFTAAAQTATPDEFAAIVVPLARRDSYSSLVNHVYATASRLASAAQKEKLDAEINRLNIRTKPR
jgi:hypothetical protein